MENSKLPREARGWSKYLVVLFWSLLSALIAGELVLRFGVGLGDPPLMMDDPLTAYRFVPSQTVHRFHHLIHYNAFSMRSDDCTARKSDPNELRVLVLGDSVINGGAATDQSEVVTTLLQKKLSTDLRRPTLVGNASCGGWDAAEEWGWVKEFGFLDADVVVLELSSHDYVDIPQFPTGVGVSADLPNRKPTLAWIELFQRYLLPRLFPAGASAEPIPSGAEAARPEDISRSTTATVQLIRAAHAHGAKVILAQHLEQEELDHGLKPGHDVNLAAAQDAGVDSVVQFGPAFAKARASGHPPYRRGDNIHPNAFGQQLMAEALEPVIEQLARVPGSGPNAKVIASP